MKKSIPSWKTMLLLAVIGLAGASAQAQLTVTQSDTAPTEDIYKQSATPVNPASISAFYRSENSPQKKVIGQGFSTIGETSPISMSGVTFHIASFTTGLPNSLSVSISIYSASSITTNPLNATLISKQIGNLPDTLLADSYTTFSFDDDVVLTPDRYYSVIFSFEDLTSTDGEAVSVFFSTVGPNIPGTSLGGSRWLGNDNVWDRSANNGFIMYVEGAPVIPETSSYALIGGAVALAAVAWSRRRR